MPRRVIAMLHSSLCSCNYAFFLFLLSSLMPPCPAQALLPGTVPEEAVAAAAGLAAQSAEVSCLQRLVAQVGVTMCMLRHCRARCVSRGHPGHSACSGVLSAIHTDARCPNAVPARTQDKVGQPY